MNLQEELKTVKPNSASWAMLHYLELEKDNDPNLAAAIEKYPKGIAEIFEYVKANAKKNEEGGCFCDDGTKVFEWVKEYVVDYEVFKAKEEEEKKKKAEEQKKFEAEIAKKSEEAKIAKAERKAETIAKAEKKAAEPKEEEKKEPEQMSLFDFI